MFVRRSILSSVDSEVISLEKQLKRAQDTERKSAERVDKSEEAMKQLAMQDTQVQQQAMGGSKVDNARKYVYMVLEYVVIDKSVERSFKKSVMGYKDPQVFSCSWPCVHGNV